MGPTVSCRDLRVRGYPIRMNLSRRSRDALIVMAVYAVAVLVMHYSGDGVSWPMSLLLGLVVTPLAFWMGWLRRRFTERAVEAGRRRFRPWPEERRR
ncbi:hypothetical protein [Streptomyces sp. cg35]|uniref:hypothetical protein n=1 Tax=Streptomyces sp. cg35 TaxID=3421650 RepID=UPI003D172B68